MPSEVKSEPFLNEILKIGIKKYDVAPAGIPKSFMPYLEPGFQFANRVSAAVLPTCARKAILKNRFVPIKNPESWKPEAGRDLNELRSNLKSACAKLEETVSRESKTPLDQMILSHSVFGRYTVRQLLAILTIHEQWHHKDLKKRLNGS